MKILSLFDGISCARVALERAGIPVEAYYASEIDRYAMQISAKNYPDIVQVGSVVGVNGDYCLKVPAVRNGFYNTFQSVYIDLLIGGFPCTNLSIAKKNREGLAGSQSGLFYEMIRIHKEVKPKFFIYENVASMAKDQKEIILKTIQEIDPSAYVIMINASLVSAQNRKRLFFTNIPNVTLPEDRGILLRDILQAENEIDPKFFVECDYDTNKTYLAKSFREKTKSNTIRTSGRGSGIDDKHNWDTIRVAIIQTPRGYNKGGIKALDGKTPTLSSSSWEHNNHLIENTQIRKLTLIECERLQSLPDNYTDGVSNSQRYKMLGNAFNVDVVAHILSFIQNINPKE